jgi:hypothetical protein
LPAVLREQINLVYQRAAAEKIFCFFRGSRKYAFTFTFPKRDDFHEAARKYLSLRISAPIQNMVDNT